MIEGNKNHSRWHDHTPECIKYNEKFFGEKANEGECICDE